MRRAIRIGLLLAVMVYGVAPDAIAQLRTQIVAQGLSSPVAFVPDPTSPSRFFIVQQNGLVRVLENGVLGGTFLDLRTVVLVGGEQGLLGMAFAPDAATSGRFFVNFTSLAGDIVVARLRRTPATATTVDAGLRFELVWRGQQPFIPHPVNGNHNGGHLAFGPDGSLYIGTGDGGSGNDPLNNAQTPTTLLGKMLRIDVNVADSHPTGYMIPPTNPFVSLSPTQVFHEIWAFGLRNPWRYSFDDLGAGATGALIVGDVGQGAREEVNYQPAGAGGPNYGWRIREGAIATPGVPPTTPAYLPLTSPLFDYERSIGRAVTGGYVYRGNGLPAAYRGRYFVADSSTSRVGSAGVSINPSNGEAALVDVIDHTAELAGGGSLGGIVSFGRDMQGELYLVTFAGRVLKIVSEGTPEPPRSLTAAVGGRTVSLQWSAPAGAPAPTAYRLEAGYSSGATNAGVFNLGPTTGAVVNSVPDGRYFVRVRAERNGLVSGPSNEVEVVVAACSPPAPLSLGQTVNGRTVSLTWAASIGASGYVVEAGSATGLADLASLPVGAATGLVVNAPPGVYYVRVRATTACGIGGPSNEVLVTVF